MKSKIYLKYLSSIIILFLSYHVIMWVFFTSKIFGLDDQTSTGDLSRMSYQLDMIQPKTLEYTLKKSFIYDKTFHNQSIDMITVGDSFSHGVSGGLNPYYQDYLSSLYNKNILNVNPIKYDQFIETVVGLHNSGFLKQKQVKYVLIQSVERFLTTRFNKEIDYTQFNLKNPEISKKIFSVQHQDISIINTANYKLPYYYLAYKFKENPKKDVHKLQLTKELFSNHKDVLIFHDDIKNIPLFTQESVANINESFNKLAKILDKDGIKLIFMPTTDKYDLYYSFIKNNPHPKNPFFDLIRPLHKDYIFIDTKAILEPLLKDNKKDIYFVDDTHWSPHGSEAVSRSKIFQNTLQE
ncbi:hypothetical protein [Sulfurimonas sp. C5]|uniref:alginate O-acetyltransferase AlgX-related protein n=1 Tax=Sulfurimonas sp. C5 TaxID=3036947 RepID=UPI0024551960|nr:hypothetical protein [Sulfurimonas sp. C5]MDH4945499.1 hypothetical protein [Sulfurimonas sp. C5]